MADAIAVRACAWCGVEFVPRGKSQETCSTTCRSRIYVRSESGKAALKRGRLKSVANDSTHGVYSRSKACRRCGSIGTVRYGGTFCSRRCALMRNRSTSTELVHVGPLPKPTRPSPLTEIPSSGRIYVAGSCQRCGGVFVIVDQLESRYCSVRCQRSTGRDRRRAVKRNAYVADVWRVRIFERDHWKCQLCGKRVARTKAVPHPRAPVVDHVIPLAKGGTHEPANAQCAHFICNSVKGDRSANDQLRLIG
jgi:5-methylcytosine-specific restriction endonuclease McrA